MEKILQKIEKLRKERGWSVSHLTAETGLSDNTIYKWLTYKVKSYPTVEALQAVCEVFGITIAQLFVKDEFEGSLIEEREILGLYNNLTPEEKLNVKQTMILMGERKKRRESEL